MVNRDIKLINIAIINYDYALASSIIGIMDIFSIVNNFCLADDQNLRFDVKILQIQKRVKNYNIQLDFHTHPLDTNMSFDMIIVPPLIDIEHKFDTDKTLLAWLKRENLKGTLIGSVCIGTYILAQAGLLEGKQATSHWVIEEKLKADFPNIRLDIDKLIVEDENIITAGGVSAYIDFCLYCTRKFISNEVAYICANYLGIDAGRVSQKHYKNLSTISVNNDTDIQLLVAWLSDHFKEEITLETMAKMISVSKRTLLRKFHKSTGYLPNQYLQKLRVEQAKHLLVNTNDSFEYITYRVGYSNSSSFRKLFKKLTGLNPVQYKEYFMVK